MISMLAVGDSLTAGFGLPPGHSFAELLERGLLENGREVSVDNAGIPGDTTSGALARIDSLLRRRPQLVLLELGANDFLMQTEPATVQRNLESMIEASLSSRASVVLAGVSCLMDPPSYARRFHQVYSDLAQKHNLPLIPDFLQGIVGNPELTQWDRLHPNTQGMQRILQGALPVIRGEVDRIASKRSMKTQ
jgi:acyl-CoA thioesterase-1